MHGNERLSRSEYYEIFNLNNADEKHALSVKRYAACLYNLIFNVKTDCGDANIPVILRALNELGRYDRIVIHYRVRQGLSCTEIGKMLGGLPEGKIRRSVERAIKKLRNLPWAPCMSKELMKKERWRGQLPPDVNISAKLEDPTETIVVIINPAGSAAPAAENASIDGQTVYSDFD